MADQKKRTAWTVQDVINGKNDDTGTLPKFKSGYSGPKKPMASIPMPSKSERAASHEGMKSSSPYMGGKMSNAMPRKPMAAKSGGILDYAWILFAAVITACVVISVTIYSVKATSHDGIYYPTRIPTVGGIVKDIIEEYKTGGLGSEYAANGGDSQQNQSAGIGENADAGEAADATDSGAGDTANSMLGASTGSSSAPNSTTGATMALDSGSTYADYDSATSYDELLEQLEKALSANDFGFVGMKLSYEAEDGGGLIGYPQSVVEHFCQYMFDNSSKREQFLSEIKDADTYMTKNGSAFLVKLPRLQFTINMGYDGTTLSISGFSDQQMDAGQSAVVSPLLPCMYTISVSTGGGSQSSEIECNMNEGNLQVNIGVTN